MTSSEAIKPPPPALLDHCSRAYAMMLSEASTVRVGDGSQDDTSMVVYEGFLTRLITQQLNLSTPYYSSVRTCLLKMGCVRQLKRGGGTAPSLWELITAPTVDLFDTLPVKEKSATRLEVMQELVDELNARLTKAEGLLNQVLEALANQYGTERADG